MAKEKKKNLKPIHWLIIAEVIVVVVGLLLGFKITYAPHLENDWDAISAVAGWASAIFSFVAILVAIQIPKRIAEQQNRIALFDKRHTFYYTFCRCISFCEGLDSVQSKDAVRMMFYTMLSDDHTSRSLTEINERITPLEIKIGSILSQGEYLFECEKTSLLEPLAMGIVNMLHTKTPKEFSDCRDSLKDIGANAKEQLTHRFEAALKLGK